jgi:hypothetical protein
MTDSRNNDNNVQKGREIYKFPVSLLRLFGINVTNLLGRRQFYRWLNEKKPFSVDIVDLIEEVIVKSIIKEREDESGIVDGIIWVISDKVEFDYFFEYTTSPKTWVWLFYLNTTPDSHKQLVEQLVSRNVPDFRSLDLPFYSSETIIFLEKSAFGETEVSLSVTEKHLDKFLEVNKSYKSDLLWANYERYGYNTESETSDDEEETESGSGISDISEEFWISENWFTERYIPTELKSKSLEKLYSGDLDSKRTEKKIRGALITKSAEVGWSSKDPIFIVSKDLNALVELWDLTTKKISLKWREWIDFLTKEEVLGAQAFLSQEFTQPQLPNLLKNIQKICCAYWGLKSTEEIILLGSDPSEFEENNRSLQKIRDIFHTRLEKHLIWLERLEKCEWEKGDEKKDWKKWKKSEYGYQNWKRRKEKLIQWLIGSKTEKKEISQGESDDRRKPKELTPYSELEKEWEEFFAKLNITEQQLNEIKEKNFLQEQILYQLLKDI